MSDVYSKEITEKFLIKYSDLEKIKDSPEYVGFCKHYSERIDNIRKIRNLATHASQNGSRPFLISSYVLQDLEDLLLKAETKCFDVGVKKSSIVFAKEDDSISSAIKRMAEENFTYLPILNKDFKLIGVISETALVNIMYKLNGEFIYDETVKVKDVIEDFLIDNNPNEYYLFRAKNDLFEEVHNQAEQGRKGKRFGACFVTESGKSSESILSMFTIWDMIYVK